MCVVQWFNLHYQGCAKASNELLVEPGSKTDRIISDSPQGRAGPQNRGEEAHKGLKRAQNSELEPGTTRTLGRSVSNPSAGNRQESALDERMSIVDDGDEQQGLKFCFGYVYIRFSLQSIREAPRRFWFWTWTRSEISIRSFSFSSGLISPNFKQLLLFSIKSSCVFFIFLAVLFVQVPVLASAGLYSCLSQFISCPQLLVPVVPL